MPSSQLIAPGSESTAAPADSRRAILVASQAHAWLGLAAAMVVAAMIRAPIHPGWTVAIATGLLCSGIIHALRRDTPGWPLEELVVGLGCCLAALGLPLLHAAYGLTIWLYAVPVVLAGTILLLWMLTRRTHAATVSARAMFTAIPPLATVMNCLC